MCEYALSRVVDACAYSLVLITLVEIGILSPCLCCIVVEGDVVYVWVLVRGACVCVHTHEVSHTHPCVTNLKNGRASCRERVLRLV